MAMMLQTCQKHEKQALKAEGYELMTNCKLRKGGY